MNSENVITFVTTNKGKVASAMKHFKDTSIKLEIYNYELDEPRSDDITKIATSKVMQAYSIVKRPCIALDSGFFIDALNGFPKAFVHFSLETIGIEGYIKLMENVKNRDCHFSECLAYYDGKNDIKYFYSKAPGKISTSISGRDKKEKWSDLWYIFIPNGYDKTLASFTDEEMKLREKTKEPSSIKQFAKFITKKI